MLATANHGREVMTFCCVAVAGAIIDGQMLVREGRCGRENWREA